MCSGSHRTMVGASAGFTGAQLQVLQLPEQQDAALHLHWLHSRHVWQFGGADVKQEFKHLPLDGTRKAEQSLPGPEGRQRLQHLTTACASDNRVMMESVAALQSTHHLAIRV